MMGNVTRLWRLEVLEPTREQKLKSLRSRLRFFKERAAALNNEYWSRSHEFILTHDRNEKHETVVAVAEPNLLKAIGFTNYDVAKAAATTRQITGACPQAIADILFRLEELYPELADYSDLTVMKKSV
jgi:hypothetical protein